MRHNGQLKTFRKSEEIRPEKFIGIQLCLSAKILSAQGNREQNVQAFALKLTKISPFYPEGITAGAA